MAKLREVLVDALFDAGNEIDFMEDDDWPNKEADFIERALGIDPDLDLDTHRLVAVPKCETCGSDGLDRPRPHAYLTCPTCNGTGDAGVPVVLPAALAEHLDAMLRFAYQGLGNDTTVAPIRKWPPDEAWDALYAYLGSR